MKNAFSLIELMVVIAIVALLAAVAAPAYKNYITKAKLSSSINFVDSNINASIRYYNAHGVFASAEELGLPFDPAGNHNTAQNVDGSYIAGGVSQITFGDNIYNFGYDPQECRYGSAVASISVDVPEGYDPLNPVGVAEGVTLINRFIDVDGIIIKRCAYNYVRIVEGVITPLSGDYIGNCVNREDNNTYDSETDNIIQTAC